ncbi:MAG: FAD-dependent oxidoreductase, partial [Candidatus Aegiribacteria sp.]|nr:FAD-dependent oxidoreductase [Candidatus Aegiribacteria sp.]
NTLLRTENILLSPGSLPIQPGPFALDGVQTSRDVLAWDSLPESLIIVGGGVIGCEFASIFSSLGVKISIVEMLPSILPGIDEDVTQVVFKSLQRSGVKILTGNPVEGIEVEENRITATLSDSTEISAERLLVSIGRKPKLEGLGLFDTGIEFTSSGIVTDDKQMTNIPGVYAAGDATGKWQLAHAGAAQGLTAVEHLFGKGERTVNPDMMPGCIFTNPEIAIVGPPQEEWERRGISVKTRISKYIANGKAVSMNETGGFIKVIARESDDTVVGIQIVGADASSLVGEAVIAVNLGVSASSLGLMIHPHPTLTELFMEAGEAFGEGAIHG